MKKAILSPLCSGLVIPGLGQVINQQPKKGICILILVFFMFVATMIELYLIISRAFETKAGTSDPVAFIDKLAAQNFSLLWYLVTAFAILWFYSVLDAYITGKKLDRLGERDRL
jgi:TM2 domain-containing membrane protein YozV